MQQFMTYMCPAGMDLRRQLGVRVSHSLHMAYHQATSAAAQQQQLYVLCIMLKTKNIRQPHMFTVEHTMLTIQVLGQDRPRSSW